MRHEAGGGHAAEGYAKATGKVGVSLGTSGPGATNLVTPICDAMMDSVPVVFLTGQVRTDLLGTDGFQEADTIGITMPIVKHSVMIQHPMELPRAIHEAFHLARTGRPGPVVVDIPTDLSRADIPYEPITDVHLPDISRPRTATKSRSDSQPRRSRTLGGRSSMRAAERSGVTRACRAGHLGPPARDLHRHGPRSVSGQPPAVARDAGMHGTRTANYAMDEADLIVAVGARFDDRVTAKLSEFAPHAKFVHIDIDPAEISKNVPAHIPIVGYAKNILPRLTAEYRALEADPSRLDEWWHRIHSWQERYPLTYEDSTSARDQAAVHDPSAV